MSKKVLISAGPTRERLDAVRFLSNRSSGKQGYAIAAAAVTAGAEVTLVSGPTMLPAPIGVRVIQVESAEDMLDRVKGSLPVDVAIFTAAVADWRMEHAETGKIKKTKKGPPELKLVENPDILSTIAHLAEGRPELVIGFAAETDQVIDYARKKLATKGCDLIIANDVSPGKGVMGGDNNTVHVVSATGVIDWPTMTKEEVARHLISHLAVYWMDNSESRKPE